MACGFHRHLFNYVPRRRYPAFNLFDTYSQREIPFDPSETGDFRKKIAFDPSDIRVGGPQERLESLSVVSAIYLCDLCRQVANTDAVVRATLLEAM